MSLSLMFQQTLNHQFDPTCRAIHTCWIFHALGFHPFVALPMLPTYRCLHRFPTLMESPLRLTSGHWKKLGTPFSYSESCHAENQPLDIFWRWFKYVSCFLSFPPAHWAFFCSGSLSSKFFQVQPSSGAVNFTSRLEVVAIDVSGCYYGKTCPKAPIFWREKNMNPGVWVLELCWTLKFRTLLLQVAWLSLQNALPMFLGKAGELISKLQSTASVSMKHWVWV